MSPALSIVLAGALAAVGATVGWLSIGGALMAAVVGSTVFWGGGLTGALLLTMFFVSGSLLTAAARWRGVPGTLPSTTSGRTARQVVANGGWAAAGALLLKLEPGGWPLILGALTTAQADTWATELGAFSPRPPRSLSRGVAVAPGTSGAVSLTGTAGGLAGGGLVCVVAIMLGIPAGVALAGLIGGIAGLFADSLIGDTVQARYACLRCHTVTEARRHWCGGETRLTLGWPWVDNDVVNFVATGFGAFVSVALHALI